MRSTTHYVRSNTPGNNLLLTSVMTHHHHHICLPVPNQPPHSLPACLSPCYGQQGPRERSQAPSGEFPLCSALYLLTTHHHHLPVTRQKSCTTQIILYPLQDPENSYHIYMVIYTYAIYIFDINMRSGSHALLHVGKSEKCGVFRVLQILYVRI